MDNSEYEASEVDSIEGDFLNGDINLLRARMCPICKTGKLLFSVYKVLEDYNALPGRRYKGSINIYCTGKCNRMLTHANAFIPAWAEDIDDWEKFSNSLYM